MTRLSRLYGVTRAGFSAWPSRPVSAHGEQDRRLATAIRTLFTAHGERYGSPRIHHALTAAGWVVSRRRVARLMREASLRAKAVRGYRAKTGVNRFFAQHPNLRRGQTTTGANQIWVGDITYLAIAGHWFYLAIIMDYHSRRVLGWSLGRRRDTRVTRAVFQAAVRRRQPVPGWRFHSDRGVEYLGAIFGACVAAAGCRQSASERGPGDNARMESFFHSMKAEATRGLQFATVAELRTHLRRYVRYYNRARAHSSATPTTATCTSGRGEWAPTP